MKTTIRWTMAALFALGLTSGCDRFDGMELEVENSPGVDYTVSRTEVVAPVGVALLVKVNTRGNDDAGRLRLRSRDEAVMSIEQGPNGRLVFVARGVGEARIDVLYKGEVADRLRAEVVPQ